MTIQTELQKIRERSDEARPGPWRWLNGSTLMADYGSRRAVLTASSHNRVPFISECNFNGLLDPLNPNGPTAEFIAHARTDIPKLLACVERLVEGLRWIDQSHASINGEDYTDLEFEMVTRASKALLDASAILTGSNEKEIDNGQLL